MPLESNAQLGHGGTGLQGDGPGTAAAMIKELQGLTVTVVAGAGANANIGIAAIATEDTLVSVIEFIAGVPTSRTATTAITTAGNIQCSVATTGNALVVTWFNKK
jgi:hypothetical protein